MHSQVYTSFEQIKSAVCDKGIDSMIIHGGANVRYVSGFTAGDAVVVIGRDEPLILVNPMFSEEAKSEVLPPFRVKISKDGVYRELEGIESSFWGEKTGFEEDILTCSQYTRLKEVIGHELTPVSGIIEELRSIKTAAEIELITRAQSVTESVFEEVASSLKEGITEKETAAKIDYLISTTGGDNPSFETIVAFGENTAKPHAVPSDTKLKKGDIVLVDMGTRLNGYMSDMTRTFCFGSAGDKFKKLYYIVQRAQSLAIEGIRAGIDCSDADRLARDYIEKEGYGENFAHSLGHGIGLEVHEGPRLAKKAEGILNEGMVVTVEPGIYIPGWGGIRIEDMVLVTQKGCTVLTNAPKAMEIKGK